MDESTSTTAPVADGVVVPRRCTLDGFATEVSQTDGIGLADLDPITTLLANKPERRLSRGILRADTWCSGSGSGTSWLAGQVAAPVHQMALRTRWRRPSRSDRLCQQNWVAELQARVPTGR